MIMTETKCAELLEVTKPIIQWMRDNNCHPQCEVRVDIYSVEMFEGIARNIIREQEEKQHVVQLNSKCRS